MVSLNSALCKIKKIWLADFIEVWYRKQWMCGITLILLESFLVQHCPEQPVFRRLCKPPDMNKPWHFFLSHFKSKHITNLIIMIKIHIKQIVLLYIKLKEATIHCQLQVTCCLPFSMHYVSEYKCLLTKVY